MIRSFRCSHTEELFETGLCVRFRNVASVALRKLDMLDAAQALTDLSAVRGNRLKALKGSRMGKYSIRVNDQYRICFRWEDGAHDVEIADYH